MKKPNIISTLVNILSQVRQNTELLRNLQHSPKNEPTVKPTPLSKTFKITPPSEQLGKYEFEIPVPPEFIGKAGVVKMVSYSLYPQGDNDNKVIPSQAMEAFFPALPQKLSKDDKMVQLENELAVSNQEWGRSFSVITISLIDEIEEIRLT